jgi:hypothetical protein
MQVGVQLGGKNSGGGGGGRSQADAEVFSGDGVTTQFVLSEGGTPYLVDVNGVLQRPGVDYTVASSVVNFTVAPDAQANNVVIHYYVNVNASTDFLARINVDTSGVGAALILDMRSTKQRMFLGTVDIEAPKTWSLANAGNALVFNFSFTITGGNHVQTMPDNFFMQSSDTRWNSGAKTWTPTGVGYYVASASFDGINWNLIISEAFS